MNRRAFILYSSCAAASAGMVLTGCDPKQPKKATDKPATDAPTALAEPITYDFFAEAEQVTLAAMLARFFPANDPSGAPSAEQAGVLKYIDGQMLRREFHGLHRMIRGGLGFLDVFGEKRHGGPFHTLSADVQDTILGRFQAQSIGTLKFPQARFFDTMHTFALEGFWGAPKYGGNRDRVVWKWVSIHPQCSTLHGTCGG